MTQLLPVAITALNHILFVFAFLFLVAMTCLFSLPYYPFLFIHCFSVIDVEKD